MNRTLKKSKMGENVGSDFTFSLDVCICKLSTFLEALSTNINFMSVYYKKTQRPRAGIPKINRNRKNRNVIFIY